MGRDGRWLCVVCMMGDCEGLGDAGLPELQPLKPSMVILYQIVIVRFSAFATRPKK